MKQVIRSEVRAQLSAKQPGAPQHASGPAGQAAKAAAPSIPQTGQPAVAPGGRRPPWLVRNSRKAVIALVLALLGASPFAYLYLKREFGPDPLAGLKLNDVRFDASTGTSEIVKPAEVNPADAMPSSAKPVATSGPIEPTPKPRLPAQSTTHAGSGTGVPVAPSFAVTHTQTRAAGGVTVETPPRSAGIPETLENNARPRVNARNEQTVPGACAEAVAALGLCDSNTTVKGK